MSGAQRARRSLWSHERTLLSLTLTAFVPALAAVLFVVWNGDLAQNTRWIATGLAVISWWMLAAGVRERALNPLRTLSNLLAGLREGDTSWKVRGARRDDALGLALLEANALRDALVEERAGGSQAGGLPREAIAAMDAAVFAFDADSKLVLVNPAGERLLMQARADLVGRDAASLGLAACLGSGRSDVHELSFAGSTARFDVRSRPFQKGGRSHELVVLTDLDRTLRQEERDSWIRLIRRVGSEVGDGLGPIRSLAMTLQDGLDRTDDPGRDDVLREGLAVIASRSADLVRFFESYVRLADVSKPELRPVSIAEVVSLVASLDSRVDVEVEAGPDVEIQADRGQLERALHELVRNAVDAVEGSRGRVRLSWSHDGSNVEIRVVDEGSGLPDPTRVFVPLESTRVGGRGLGLVLARQLAEAHGGSLHVENRDGEPGGCQARLRLPL